MKRLYLMSLAGAAAAVMPTATAQAAVTLVGTFAGNQCGGAGGFPVCYASGTSAGSGAVLKTAGGSPSIIRIENGGAGDVGGFASINGSEFSTNYVSATNNLSFTYTPGVGDPTAHYFGIFQGGSAPGGDFNNTYQLFYDPNPITSGSIALSTYFNNQGWSHIDFFDTGGTPTQFGAVPEPASWAMILLGFGAIGMAMRVGRKATVKLRQIA